MSEIDPIAEAEAVGTRLLDAIREAHGVLRDLRSAQAETRDATNKLRVAAQEAIDSGISAEVARGLADYQTALAEAIEMATEKVYERFDTLGDLLMGEDKHSRSRAEPSLAELVRAAQKERAMTDWRDFAACKGMTAVMFPDQGRGMNNAGVERARTVCRRCDVQAECLEYALRELRADMDVGVWAGTTRTERQKIRSRRKRLEMAA